MKVLVTGASSQIGDFLLPRLVEKGWAVHAISRQTHSNSDHIRWLQFDLENLPTAWQHTDIDVLFHLARLPLAPDLITRLPKLRRVIAFSSTSRFTKSDSVETKEQAVAQQLAQAEAGLEAACQARQIPWTIFRPTLIYGCGKDQNVSFIAQFIQRFGVFPVALPGKGLRQPVHADDLAQACLQAMGAEASYHQAYNLSGGETLDYREMVRRIFVALDKSPRILPLPLVLLHLAFSVARYIPRFRHLSASMFTRMNQDLCFDHAAASRDFNYQARGFLPNRQHLGV